MSLGRSKELLQKLPQMNVTPAMSLLASRKRLWLFDLFLIWNWKTRFSARSWMIHKFSLYSPSLGSVSKEVVDELGLWPPLTESELLAIVTSIHAAFHISNWAYRVLPIWKRDKTCFLLNYGRQAIQSLCHAENVGSCPSSLVQYI